MSKIVSVIAVIVLCSVGSSAWAGVLTYGDKDLLGTGSYPIDPTTGATLQGLASNVVTFGAAPVGHSYPFTPAGDFLGTDQIYIGSNQLNGHDGYSGSAERVAGPQVLTLDYSSLVSGGASVTSLTLGIAADDFQFSDYGQPFTASINGLVNTTLTDVLNGLQQGGPLVQFFTIGLSLSDLLPSHTLTLTIDNLGDGGDGWAVDFLTVGVTTDTSAVPEPSSVVLMGFGAAGLLGYGLRRRRAIKH